MSQRTTIIIGSSLSLIFIVALGFWWLSIRFPSIINSFGNDSSGLANEATEANDGFTQALTDLSELLPTSTPIVTPTPTPMAPVITTSSPTSSEPIIIP